ncbi:MAG: hypothetical protein V8S34_01770 [Lawsonibacter sp.]
MEGLLAPDGFAPDTVVSVDIAARGLFPTTPRISPRVDLAIDHHPSQEFFAQRTCLDAGRAACGELMYDILRLLGPVTRHRHGPCMWPCPPTAAALSMATPPPPPTGWPPTSSTAAFPWPS